MSTITAWKRDAYYTHELIIMPVFEVVKWGESLKPWLTVCKDQVTAATKVSSIQFTRMHARTHAHKHASCTHTHTHTCPGLCRWAVPEETFIHSLMRRHAGAKIPSLFTVPNFTCHLLGFMMQGKITGRCNDNLAGCHPIRTIDAPTSIISIIFMPHGLPVAMLPIYPGLEQAPIMLDCIPDDLVQHSIQT